MNAQSHRRCLGTDEGVPMLPSDATFRCCVLMRAFRRQFHTTAGIQQSCHCSLHQSCYALCGHIVRGVTPTLICEVMTPTSASLSAPCLSRHEHPHPCKCCTSRQGPRAPRTGSKQTGLECAAASSIPSGPFCSQPQTGRGHLQQREQTAVLLRPSS